LADNVAITAGAGTNVATDERSINSVTVHVQRVGEIGAAAIANGQTAPTNSAANIVAARETRKTVTLVNHGSVDVYVGAATVTTANGVKVPAGASITIPTTAAVQGITASGTGAVHYVETYD
jgi:hypothetical protein